MLKHILNHCALFTLTLYFTQPAISQASERLIDMDRVSPVVQDRFKKIGADLFTSPQQFTLSCNESFDFAKEEFEFNHMEFEINENIEKVWQSYMNVDIKESWNGKSIQFDFGYSKPLNQVYYRDSETPKLHVGLGVFLILEVLNLKKIPTSMEVSKIDTDHKTIEYTYLTQNTSHGRQSVRLLALGNNKTKMIHDTFYKSGHSFRDKMLYPPIHEDLIQEFHQNILARSNLNALRVK